MPIIPSTQQLECNLDSTTQDYKYSQPLLRDVSFSSGMEVETCVNAGNYANVHHAPSHNSANVVKNATVSQPVFSTAVEINGRVDSLDLYPAFRDDSYSETSSEFSNENGTTTSCVIPAGLGHSVGNFPVNESKPDQDHVNTIAHVPAQQNASAGSGYYTHNGALQAYHQSMMRMTNGHGIATSVNSSYNPPDTAAGYLNRELAVPVFEETRTSQIPVGTQEAEVHGHELHHLTPVNHGNASNWDHSLKGSYANGYHPAETVRNFSYVGSVLPAASSSGADVVTTDDGTSAINPGVGSSYISLNNSSKVDGQISSLITVNADSPSIENGNGVYHKLQETEVPVNVENSSKEDTAKQTEDCNASENLGEIIKKSIVETVSA